jgi:hypothetical protein
VHVTPLEATPTSYYSISYNRYVDDDDDDMADVLTFGIERHLL